jgi:hypothetical protein
MHIKNEGITRDVHENKRTKNVTTPLPRDVDEKQASYGAYPVMLMIINVLVRRDKQAGSTGRKQRMKAPHEKGVANHSAPSSARDVARNAENSGETMKLTADLKTHTSRIGNRRFEIASFTSTDRPMARGADNSRSVSEIAFSRRRINNLQTVESR